MVVQSGNDACIALAEAVAGAEEAFVQAMNREAARLGLKSTKFMNATGLPDPQHYSTAQDLYLLAAALIRDFPKEYARITRRRSSATTTSRSPTAIGCSGSIRASTASRRATPRPRATA